MKYEHVLAAFCGEPWAILPEKLEAIRAFLLLKAAGGDVDPAELAALSAARHADGVQMVGRVAVLPVMGVISQRAGLLEQASGGVGTESIGASLDALVADKACRAVVMAFDSPGGSVFGVGELAEKIRAARDQKKVVAMVDSTCASAAYWLAAQCSEVNVTPGGMLGSIGVISAHQDISKAQEMDGVKTTVVTSSPYKAEGSPFGALSDEARAELQSKVNHHGARFVADVAKGRGVTDARVRADFGQGRMVTAQDAVSRGMADRTATLAQVLRRLGAPDGASAHGDAPPLSAYMAAVRARAVEVGE